MDSEGIVVPAGFSRPISPEGHRNSPLRLSALTLVNRVHISGGVTVHGSNAVPTRVLLAIPPGKMWPQDSNGDAVAFLQIALIEIKVK